MTDHELTAQEGIAIGLAFGKKANEVAAAKKKEMGRDFSVKRELEELEEGEIVVVKKQTPAPVSRCGHATHV
jgi:hypothetical protein